MLKLVVDNSIIVKKFSDYTDAVDFLAKHLKNEKELTKLLTTRQALDYFSSLCNKHIVCHEPDEGECEYRVRIMG